MLRFLLTRQGISFFSIMLISGLLVWSQQPLILEDQFGGRTDIAKTLAEGTTLLIAGNTRDAPERLSAWKKTLRESGSGDIPIILVCDLSAIPFFIPKKAVIVQLASTYQKTQFFLDWKGMYTGTFIQKNSMVTSAIIKKGTILLKITGDASSQSALRLLSLK